MAILNRRFVRTFRRTTPGAPVLALVNASLHAFAELLFSPYLLATFIFLLGGSNQKIALPLVISGAAWAFSSPVKNIIGRISPPGRYLATASGIIRTGAAAFIAWLGYAADDVDPVRLIDLLLMCFAVYVVASAFNVTTTRGLIAASTPAIRAGSLFSLQRIFSGVASVAAGIVAIYALRSGELEFYDNIGILYLLGAVGVAAATWFQFMTTVAAIRATTPASSERSNVWVSLANPAVRRLLGFRVLVGLATLADPFLIVFGIRELGFDIFYVGVAITLYAGGQLVAALSTPGWVSKRGPRSMLMSGSVARLFGIAIALTIPPLSRTSLYTDRFDNAWPATVAFVALFAFLGISAFGQAIGSQRYIYDVVPVANRISTIALTNLVLGVSAFAPLLGAYLIGQYDLDILLVIATTLTFVGLASAGFLVDSSPRVVHQRGAWRQRRNVRRIA